MVASDFGKFVMTENFEQALAVDVLAAALSLDQQEAGDILRILAQKFVGGLPRHTKVQRSLWGFGAVQAVTISFEDCQYEVSRSKYGSLVAKSIEVVRGIKIKTNEISIEEWSQAVANTLALKAQQSAEIRAGLQQFIVGDI
jgi:hypothetical protein